MLVETDPHTMNAATQVFNIPELLELILLAFPQDYVYQEISAIRTTILGQTTSRTWRFLVLNSTPIRQRLYYPTPIDAVDSQEAWQQKHPFPPARPNPWIPDLLLNQRSWGSAYPFDTAFTQLSMQPSQPRLWTFSFELSRAQYDRLPEPGPWRDMLLASPPFYDFWYTRCFYELGSGRAPFVTHLDYNAELPKSEQTNRVHCPQGVTLGHICDAVSDLFGRFKDARFVMVESLRVPIANAAGQIELSEDRPTTKSYIPGSSAEKAYGWQRSL